MLWTRKTPADGAGALGLDLDGGRARAVGDGGRPLALDGAHDELPLLVRLDGRRPEVGLAALATLRRTPHLVAANALPRLGHPDAWAGPRLTLTPEGAVAAALEALRPSLASPFGLVLPAYLTLAQTRALHELMARARLPLAGSAPAPLAVAAHRSARLLAPPPREGVVPLRPSRPGPGDAVVIDLDDHALSASVLRVAPSEVTLTATASWPRAGQRLMLDRLLDAVADRCVRVCRRDPRDSVAAEQALYEQLPTLLERAQRHEATTLPLRAERWYQDLVLAPADVAGFLAPLATFAVTRIAEFLDGLDLAGPPRLVWLGHAAARVPGLAAELHARLPEACELALLPAGAAAEAAAALLPRWRHGSLPNLLEGRLPADPGVGRAASRVGG